MEGCGKGLLSGLDFYFVMDVARSGVHVLHVLL